MPLGIDTFNVEARTRRACEEAGVVMFPAIPFMENGEAVNNPGAVAIRAEVLMPFLWNIFDEIARNGFRKIVLVNGHGGNNNLVGYLLQDFLQRDRDYMIYLCTVGHDPKLMAKVLETEIQDHAGEMETSMSLCNVPELVKMENVPDKPYPKKGRAAHLKEAQPAPWWCADVPNHYVGDARPATPEKGRIFLENLVERMVACFESVKKDTKTAEVWEEYRTRRAKGGLAP